MEKTRRRILVIGCPGSGKTWLSNALAQKLALPVVHLDKLWWTGTWENVTVEEFDRQLEAALRKEAWIMDGNYSRTIPRRLQRCDCVIWLDYSPWQCLWGMTCRVLGNYGKSRPDMGGNCPERFDWEFIRYILHFNRENRAMLRSWLAQAGHAERIVLKNRREVRAFLKSL